jgi:tetratricopeptide (TPR) repeat protein
MEEPGIENLINEFLAALPAKKRRMLETSLGARLLGREAEGMLRAIAREATARGDDRVAWAFKLNADLLAHCRERGVAAVFDSLDANTARQADPSLPNDAQAAFAELMRLDESETSDRASLERKIALCRILLPTIDRGASAEEWATICGILGNALSQQGRLAGDPRVLAEAVAACHRALEVYTKQDAPQAWGSIQKDMGNALMLQGQLTGDVGLLAEAVAATRCALEVYRRDETPRAWGILQGSLGNALAQQGRQTADPHLLADALDAFRRALEVFSGGETLRLWGETQINLGAALSIQSDLTGNPHLLAEAVAAYRSALRIFKKEDAPQDWALTQNNISNALLRQSKLTGDLDLRAEAVAAVRAALEVYSNDETPHDWARAQNSLGSALQEQGELMADPRLLGEAIVAFQSVLEVFSRDEAPQVWGWIQMNVGKTLAHQGNLTGDPRLFAEAIAANRRALEVFSKEEAPAEWGKTQNNLGNALLEHGALTDDPHLFAEAVAAYRRALAVYSKEETPLDWGRTQHNIGTALLIQAELTDDPLRLAEAAATYRGALEVYSKEETPRAWGMTQNNLGNALARHGELTDDPHLFTEAATAYRCALEVYSKEKTPRDWGQTQHNIGTALLIEAERAGHPHLLPEAITACRRALEVRVAEHTPIDYLNSARALAHALFHQEAGRAAIDAMEPLLSAGTALVLAEPSQQRQRVLLERLSGLGDDLAAANIALGDTPAAIVALGRGRAIVLNLTAAITGLDNRTELQKARSNWRATQGAADKAEERERVVESMIAEGHGDPINLSKARATAARARQAVHESYLRFRTLLREADLDQPEALEPVELSAAIPPGGALVMPVIPSRGDGCVLILTAGEHRPKMLPLPGLTRSWLSQQLNEWFRGYGQFHDSSAHKKGHVDGDDIDAWNRTIVAVLTDVGVRLMAPVDKVLRERPDLATGKAEVILMLPGRLSALPLHAAPVTAEGAIFLDHWIVRQVANPRMLLAAHKASARTNEKPSLLGITNPKGDLGVSVNPAAKLHWFPDGRYKDLVGPDATIGAVRESLPHHTHVCFYCHGGWDPRDPEQSGLELSDGIMKATAMRELELGVSRFAMLAACETALHDLTRIPDEFVSLPIALNEAGVPCIAASLWPVPVGPTRNMVEGVFRRQIQDALPPAAALRATQLDLRGPNWRFPLAQGVLGFGTPADTTAGAATSPLPQDVPDLYAWAGFACFGG